MKYMINITDQVEIDALEELSSENGMTPEQYLLSMAMTFINNRLRGKLLEETKKMTMEDVKTRLKEKVNVRIN